MLRPEEARHGRIGALIGIGTFAVYLAISPQAARSWDGQVMYAVARNIVDNRSLTVPRPVVYEGRLIIPAGERIIAKKYSHYGIGVSVLLLVPYGLQRLLGMHGHGLVLLANPLVLALTSVMVYGIGLALRLRTGAAVAGALGFGLLSMAPAYSMELFSEPLVALATAAFVLGLLWWGSERKGGPPFVGAALAMAVLARADSLLLLGAALAALPAFVPVAKLRQRPQDVLTVVVPLLAAVAWTVWYTHLRDGVWSPRPYGGGSFDVPLTTGLHGMLYSPGKGFFWYNPFLLVGVVGIARLWARERALVLLFAFVIVGRLLFYARWTFWAGDAAWGPRFLLPACVPLAVGAAVALDRLAEVRRVALRVAGLAAVAALAVVGVVVNVASVVAPYWLWWDVINQPLRPGAIVARQIADSYWTWDLSGLRYSFELFGDGPSQLAHFADGPDAIAIVGLATGAMCLALAFTAATTKRSS